MNKPKLLFLVTEDWFFQSHFIFLARRAVAEGYECVVATRNTGALKGVEGLRLVEMPFFRRSFAPWEIAKQISEIRDVVARERPFLIHAIALKPIVLLALAKVQNVAQVFALTGRGYIALGRAPWTRLIRWRLRRLVRCALRRPRTLLMVENMSDAAWVARGERLDERKIVLMPGAGVDLEKFTLAPEPVGDPIIVGVVARLIRSKGIGNAVEAVRRLRAEGFAICLRIAGAPDEQNPDCISAAELARWAAVDGIELIGHQSDINAFWSKCHIACLPSLGGEGLPRALIEAAACGRPIVTTNTPGCADFVGPSHIGLLVEPGNVDELAAALRDLGEDANRRQRMGSSARSLVAADYGVSYAGDVASRAWHTVSDA